MPKNISRWAGVAIAAYFLYFAAGAARAFFAADDMMNMGQYWAHGILPNILDNLRFWSTAYRPMGAAFYLPIYFLFGLNPLPYRIACLALIAANIFFTYRVALMLTKSDAVAALAAILATTHPVMESIYYHTSMIYDILAYFYTVLMLFTYMKGRQSGQKMTIARGLAVAAFYIAALNSKEIAIVGAGWILAYEVLFHRPRKLLLPAILLVMGIAYAAGKSFGPNALAKQGGYLLDPTWHRYFVNNRLYVNDFFVTTYWDTSRKLVFGWLILTIVCAVARKRELWWAWFVASTAALPISFTVQPRNGGALYLPLFGFALLGSILTVGFFKPPAIRWGAAILVATLWGHSTIHLWRERKDAYINDELLTWSAITKLRELPAKPKPGTHVLFLKDPFHDWDMVFISWLVWNDHTLDVQLADKFDKPPDPEKFDWVLTFEGDDLRVVKMR